MKLLNATTQSFHTEWAESEEVPVPPTLEDIKDAPKCREIIKRRVSVEFTFYVLLQYSKNIAQNSLNLILVLR